MYLYNGIICGMKELCVNDSEIESKIWKRDSENAQPSATEHRKSHGSGLVSHSLPSSVELRNESFASDALAETVQAARTYSTHADFHRESVALAIEREPYYRIPEENVPSITATRSAS